MDDSSKSARAPQRIAHSVDETVQISGTSRTSVYEAIRSGELKAKKLGRRTLVLDDDLRAWLASLPSFGEAAA